MTKHDAIKHLSYKIAFAEQCGEKYADVINIEALEIAVRAMAEERKQGKWIPDPPEGTYQLYKCSVCGYLWPYWYASAMTIEQMTNSVLCCPKCYADMKGIIK